MGYVPQNVDLDALVNNMEDKKDGRMVNLDPLKEALKNIGVKKKGQAQEMVKKMPEVVKIALDNISKWLEKNEKPLKDFHA